jgi:hypothetical protein
VESELGGFGRRPALSLYKDPAFGAIVCSFGQRSIWIFQERVLAGATAASLEGSSWTLCALGMNQPTYSLGAKKGAKK